MLASINGKIAFHSQESSNERIKNKFTCEYDFEHMRSLVSQCDVVFHGARSIETEEGAFRVAHLREKNDEPLWVIFTRSGEISFQSSFWRQKNVPKSIFFVTSFNTSEDPILNVQENEYFFGKITCFFGNINGLFKYLIEHNLTKIALLGGGKLNAAFWENKLVNELYLTLSPFAVGGEYTPNLFDFTKQFHQKLELKKSEIHEQFIFLNYQVLPS